MLYYFIYTLITCFVWFYAVQDIAYLGRIGLFLGLLYTYYSAYLVRNLVLEETKVLKAIKYIGPIFFLGWTFFSMSYLTIYTVLNPIIIGFLLLSFSLREVLKFPKVEVQFFTVFFIFLYSFSLHSNIWEYYLGISERKQYKFELPKTEKTPEALPEILPLAHYNFINQALDTIKINPSGKYTIIETWNEKCPPCMLAIPEMHDFYEAIAPQANQYYLYIPAGKKRKLDYQKVFTFDRIKRQDRILIDVNLQTDTELEEYPVFLVFNPKGERVFLHIGYNSAKREELQGEIKALLEK